jgi:hypothetical protein
MTTEATATKSTPSAQPSFNHPTLHASKSSQSAPGSGRRHSLPLHFLPPNLWSANTSTASLAESEQAARGEHILGETTVAHRISALRQLNGANRSGHRYAKSTGARNSTFSQPVIVRTYSGAPRPLPERRDLVTVRTENGASAKATAKMDLKLPPVEAFSFKGIMDEIRQGVTEDLERIAEICARSKYSLSNQYEVHMPPHGRGDAILQTISHGSASRTNGVGPTLQAIGSDDEQTRHVGRGSRGGRRPKSAAYGTLETIMSSSRSSDEDKSKKKPAAELAEEVRGRAAKKELDSPTKKAAMEDAIGEGPAPQRSPKHVRSKSATFASMIIDNAQGFKNDAVSHTISPGSLISGPARPQTSTANLGNVQAFGDPVPSKSPTLDSLMSATPTLIRNKSRASTLKPESDTRPSILGSFSSWFSWSRPSGQMGNGSQGRMRSASHAEGSLRELLKSTDIDRKGKGVDRAG